MDVGIFHMKACCLPKGMVSCQQSIGVSKVSLSNFPAPKMNGVIRTSLVAPATYNIDSAHFSEKVRGKYSNDVINRPCLTRTMGIVVIQHGRAKSWRLEYDINYYNRSYIRVSLSRLRGPYDPLLGIYESILPMPTSRVINQLICAEFALPFAEVSRSHILRFR